MNYFERLVRRALVRPASASGAALDDPFETVAHWQTETPAGKPAPHAAPLQEAVRPPLDPASEATVPAVIRPAAQAAAVADVPFPLPPSTAAASPLPPLSRGADETPPAPLPEDAPPRATRIAPPVDALALADAFMRSLGAQSQLPEPAPEAASQLPSASAPVPTTRPAPPALAPQAQVVPPAAPPPPVPPPRVARAVEKHQAPAPEPAGQGPREAARTRTVVETRHVVVERAASTDATRTNMPAGGGSPRFGLGQL